MESKKLKKSNLYFVKDHIFLHFKKLIRINVINVNLIHAINFDAKGFKIISL